MINHPLVFSVAFDHTTVHQQCVSVVPENVHIHSPHRNSWGRGVPKAKNIKETHEALLEFPEGLGREGGGGWGGCSKEKKMFLEGGGYEC